MYLHTWSKDGGCLRRIGRCVLDGGSMVLGVALGMSEDLCLNYVNFVCACAHAYVHVCAYLCASVQVHVHVYSCKFRFHSMSVSIIC